jgi:hypothetical protein
MNPITWNIITLIANLQNWQPKELVSMVINNNKLNILQKMYLRRYLFRTNSRTDDENKAAYMLCMDMWPHVTCMRPLSEEYNR